MGLTREVKQRRADRRLIVLLRALVRQDPGATVVPAMIAAADRLEALTGGPPAPIGAKWKEGRGR